MTQADVFRLLASRKTEDRIRGIGLLRRSEDAQKQTLLLKALEDRSHYVAAPAAETVAKFAYFAIPRTTDDSGTVFSRQELAPAA